MINILSLEQKEIIKGYKARFIHTNNTTLVFWEVEKGAVMPMHSHSQEQTTQVMEGKFELMIGDDTRIYEKGSLAVIPSNVKHGGIALNDCKLFDVFSPVREDYKNL
jgi:quercetin dioxygenase-like cupin family protein